MTQPGGESAQVYVQAGEEDGTGHDRQLYVPLYRGLSQGCLPMLRASDGYSRPASIPAKPYSSGTVTKT
ncbi:hypothetical protein GCM10012289_33440 [Nonomuraea cavernae]|uniref:Uncharacterized protein n=1 Tax=Nonomuraea cavernae TaxID=2045107 RepID=A0A917YY96_9ACTN|nr:hypothetical protein GCM10012289_33440 [Nonomuraea cavernae]